MSPDSYRTLPRLDPSEPKPNRAERPWDVTVVVAIVWVVAVAHLLIAWRSDGSAARDLTMPWLVLIFAPFIIHAERLS